MTSEDKQVFLNEAGALLEQIGVELQMLDGNTADLASVVAIIEKLDALKDLSEKANEERTFQFAFAMSELLSGVLCERFDNPEEILGGVENSLGGLKAHLEALADGVTEAEAAPEILTQLYTWLEVPVVKLEKIEVTGDIIFEKPTGEAPAQEVVAGEALETEEAPSSELPAEPETTQAETAPAATPEPQAAEPAATATPLEMDLTDDEVASTGLPAAFDDVDLFREFAFEANEHLETIEETVLELEANPTDTDLINQIFRPIHSVKGGAGFLALTGMNKLAHTTETLLDRCRKLELPVTPEIIDICLKSSDALQQMIANLINACEAGDPNAYECLPVVYGPIRQTIQQILDTENPHLTMGDTPGAASATPATSTETASVPEAEPTQASQPPHDEPQPEDGDMDDETWASKGIPPSIDDEEDIELLKRFIFQCNEHTESIEEKILSLEENPDDQELLDGVFRAMHSMKGDSGFLALTGISTLAHETETLLSKVRNGDIKITGRPVELCLESVDALKQMIDNLNSWVEAKDRDSVELDLIVFGPICEKIRRYLENPDAPPKLGEILVESGDLKQDQLDQALELQGAPLGEVLTKTGMSSPDKIAKALNQQKAAGGAGASGAAKAIKVDTEKIDTLVNLVGELVIIEAQVAQMGSALVAAGNGQGQVMEKNLSQLSKITKELQDRSMALRMMPIKQTFQKMQRLVRDSSKKVGKKVNLVLTGEDTELDKTVVEQIGDPLVHMLRNSVDHGLETTEERKAAGKPDTGRIDLEAYYQGDRIKIRVADDGRGLPKDRIIEKAIENGLIESSDGMTDNEIFKLIFAPGFSTAQEITDISGRGVGMDVVKRNIEKLRGTIEVKSEPGKGTEIIISLPLTLAIIDGMVVRVGDEEYIIPTASIKESLKPQKQDMSTVTERGEMINVRGSLTPLVRLYELWNIEPNTIDPTESLVVIVENTGRRACVMVDELVGQQQIVIKNLGKHFGDVKGIAGATILGNGRVGLIVDVDGLIRRALNN